MDTTTTQAERAHEAHEEELARLARREAYKARQAAARLANGGVRPPNDFERTQAKMREENGTKAKAAGISLKEFYRQQQTARRRASGRSRRSVEYVYQDGGEDSY